MKDMKEEVGKEIELEVKEVEPRAVSVRKVFLMRFHVKRTKTVEIDDAGEDDVKSSMAVTLESENVNVTLTGDVGELEGFTPGDSVDLFVTGAQTTLVTE